MEKLYRSRRCQLANNRAALVCVICNEGLSLIKTMGVEWYPTTSPTFDEDFPAFMEKHGDCYILSDNSPDYRPFVLKYENEDDYSHYVK